METVKYSIPLKTQNTTVKKKSKKKKIKKKVAKVLNHGNVKRWLLGWNPYLQTILDPWNVRGVRVPDIITTPSGTFSIRDQRTLTVNANGLCGILYGMGISGVFPTYTPCGALCPYNTGLPTLGAYAVGVRLGANSSSSSILAAGSANIQLSKFDSSVSSVATLYSSVRLVSFGVSIQYTGSALSAKGKITMASEPRETYGQSNKVANASLTLDDIAALRSSSVTSVPLKGGASAVYFPQDATSVSYYSTQTNYGLLAFPRAVLGGEVYCVVDGATANETFFVTAVWNFEGIPFSNQLDLVATQPSKADPLAMSHASNVISDLKPTLSTPVSVNSGGAEIEGQKESQSITHHETNDKETPSLFENFVGMLDQVPSLVSKGMAAVESLSPVVSMFL